MNEQKLSSARQIDSNRLYLDVVKGTAIFLMLWGHCIQYCANDNFDFFENSVFKFIYSFHMPLFMLVSGYLFCFSFKKRNLQELLVHRTQSLLQPLFMCTIINYFITYAINGGIMGIIDGPWISNLYILWFLWSVLSSSIAIGVTYKVFSNRFFRIVGIVLGILFVCLFPNWASNVYMYPYFVIGFLFSYYKNRIPNWILKMKYIFLIIFPIMIMFYEKKHYIYTSGIVSSDSIIELISIDGFRWAVGLAGSVFMLVVLELICKYVFSKYNKLATPLAALGKKSLQIYCLSVAFLSYWLPIVYEWFCKLAGSIVFASNMYIYNFVFTPALAIIYSILIYYIVKLMEKIKISKIVFGR